LSPVGSKATFEEGPARKADICQNIVVG